RESEQALIKRLRQHLDEAFDGPRPGLVEQRIELLLAGDIAARVEAHPEDKHERREHACQPQQGRRSKQQVRLFHPCKPKNVETKGLAGLRQRSRARPVCSMRPLSMTAIRSAIARASS